MNPRRHRQGITLSILALVLLASRAAAAEAPHLEVAGLEIGAVDLEKSAELYRDVLGFSIVPGGSSGDAVRLVNGGVEVTLRRAARPASFDPAREAHVYLNLEVHDLAAVAKKLEARGLGWAAPPRETAIGTFAALRDPAGNVHQVVEKKPRSPQPFPPRVFNIGIRLESMAAAKAFYCGVLGFEVMSENHPPPIIPLKPKGKAPLILFEGVPARAAAGEDVARVVLVLEDAGLTAPRMVEDPSGNQVKITPRPGPPGRGAW